MSVRVGEGGGTDRNERAGAGRGGSSDRNESAMRGGGE